MSMSRDELIVKMTLGRGQAVVGALTRIDFFADCVVVTNGPHRYELYMEYDAASGAVRRLQVISVRRRGADAPTVEPARRDLAPAGLCRFGQGDYQTDWTPGESDGRTQPVADLSLIHI